MKLVLASLLDSVAVDGIFNTLNEKDLVVSTENKELAVMTEKGLERIVSHNNLNKLSSVNGYVEIPVKYSETSFSKLLLQWGRVDLQPQVDTTFDYHVPFTEACYVLQATPAYNGDISVIKMDKVSNSQFKIKSMDGSSVGRIYWVAIGV